LVYSFISVEWYVVIIGLGTLLQRTLGNIEIPKQVILSKSLAGPARGLTVLRGTDNLER